MAQLPGLRHHFCKALLNRSTSGCETSCHLILKCLTVSTNRCNHHACRSAKNLTTKTNSRRLCSSFHNVDRNSVTNDNSDYEKDLPLFPVHQNINQFVPVSDPVAEEDVSKFQDFVQNSRRLLVLTGAGISTESGIPDYRSEGVGLYARSTNRPVQYQDFVKYPEVRKRYWARNYVGWPKFGFFLPNSCHTALSDWEHSGKVHWIVTQNVDALHYKAGSRKVTELHGSAHRVMCLGCTHKMSRPEMQDLIESYNSNWTAHSEEMAPDADVQLSAKQIEGFQVPPCPSCGGPLKPEITFFGDNVAKHMVDFVHQRVRESDGLLLAGTSLQVYSGYRFASAAHDQNKPIAIVNIGPTRADKLASLQINAKCGDVIPRVVLS